MTRTISRTLPLELTPQLLQALRCPATKGPVAISEDKSQLENADGSRRYPITDGVPLFQEAQTVPEPFQDYSVDISVLIMALNEAGNIELVIADVARELSAMGTTYEIVVLDGGSTDDTQQRAADAGAKVISQASCGYAQGLVEGLKSLLGRYVITLDGDCSHDSGLMKELVEAAAPGCLVIGSRWMAGGSFQGPFHRKFLSRLLSVFFTRLLHIPVSDISSGYRLYSRETLFPDDYVSHDFSILEEILVRARHEGFELREVPLHYKQRQQGSSNARLAAFAISYLATLKRMWMLRHDASAADYEDRAYNSLNVVQRWWQHKRFRNIRTLMQGYVTHGDVLDIGCGSSKIIQSLPHAVALDTSIKKLRFLRTTNPQRVCGDARALPFKDNSFDCVILSQVIGYLPQNDAVLAEAFRVLRPGGYLILGTVDYGTWIWPTIERMYRTFLPHAYRQQQISRYTLESLTKTLSSCGFRVEEVTTILRSEITIRATRL